MVWDNQGKNSFSFEGETVRVSLPSQGSNTQDWFLVTSSCTATSEAAPSFYGGVGPGGPAGSQGSMSTSMSHGFHVAPSPPKDPSSYSFTEFCRCLSNTQYLEKSSYFKLSCKSNDLFPSSSVTFDIFCSFQDYCALEPHYTFLFLNKGSCKVIEKYHLPLKQVPEIL